MKSFKAFLNEFEKLIHVDPILLPLYRKCLPICCMRRIMYTQLCNIIKNADDMTWKQFCHVIHATLGDCNHAISHQLTTSREETLKILQSYTKNESDVVVGVVLLLFRLHLTMIANVDMVEHINKLMDYEKMVKYTKIKHAAILQCSDIFEAGKMMKRVNEPIYRFEK